MTFDDVAGVLLEMWRVALRQPELSLTDDLFDRGSHSMLILTMAQAIGERLSVEVPPGEMFDLVTVEQLASYVTRNLPAEACAS
jgi:acyl carrier protein